MLSPTSFSGPLSQVIKPFAAVMLLLFASACSPYRIDVQQGNYLTQKEIAKLHKGMSKREVRYILGTPLIIDPFHNDRWEYYYSFRSGSKSDAKQRRLTIVFSDDKVKSIEGDSDLPAATESPTGGTKVVQTPGKEKKKGIFKRAIEKIKGTDSAKDEY